MTTKQNKAPKFKSLPGKEKSKMLLRYMVNVVWQNLQKQGVKSIDSNFIHFVLYNAIKDDKKMKKFITVSWYYHGPYIWLLDDVLIETFGMDPKYHQMTGDEECKFDFVETKFITKPAMMKLKAKLMADEIIAKVTPKFVKLRETLMRGQK